MNLPSRPARYLVGTALTGLLLASFLPATAADPAPTTCIPQPLRPAFDRLRHMEIVQMLTAIADGSHMGPGEGWFHPGRSRYGWDWLAARHGIDAKGSLDRRQFRGPAEVFERLDRNHDGVLNAEDFDWSDRAPFLREAGLAAQWARVLDTDSNGRITRAEWDALFEKATKGKSYLTADDLREALTPPPRKPGAKDEPSPLVLFKGLLSGELGSFLEGPAVGERAPDFTLKTLDGKQQIALGQYRGVKPVVLVFGSFT